MTDIKTLALKYGGYTSLDKVYLDQLLASSPYHTSTKRG